MVINEARQSQWNVEQSLLEGARIRLFSLYTLEHLHALVFRFLRRLSANKWFVD